MLNGERVAGVDEAGRGCLAGPVYAAAVILDRPLAGLRDSKQLSATRREELACQIRACSIWGLGQATKTEIERMNILQASLLAMQRAVAALAVRPELVLVDGNRAPSLPYQCQAIVKGDTKVNEIMAASILAKTARDALMGKLDRRYPGYGLARHKGYPTRAHLAALRSLGVLPIHRRNYAPVRALLHPSADHIRATQKPNRMIQPK